MISNRIMHEFTQYNQHPVSGINFEMDETNVHKWDGSIIGPTGSPYEGGIFEISIQFPENYPIDPPSLYFRTQIYHPCVDNEGKFCLPILTNEWNPYNTIIDAMLGVKVMLQTVESINDGNAEMVKELKENKAVFIEKAKKMTKDKAC